MSKTPVPTAVYVPNSAEIRLIKGTNLVTACEKGGTGKTFFLQALIARCRSLGLPIQILEFDEGERLRPLLGDDCCKFFKLSPKNFREYERNPQLLYAMWDDAMGIARRSDGVVCWDLGANASKPLCDYLVEQHGRGYFGLGENTLVFGVANGDPSALTSVQKSLGYFAQALPKSRRVLVINDIDQNFPIDRDAEAIKKIADHLQCTWGYVERVLAADVLGKAFAKKLSLDALAAKDTGWWMKEFQIEEDTAIRLSARLETFLIDAANILEGACSSTATGSYQ